VIPLSKGFYEFEFSSLEDTRSLLSIGIWRLSPDLLVCLHGPKILIPLHEIEQSKMLGSSAWFTQNIGNQRQFSMCQEFINLEDSNLTQSYKKNLILCS